MDQFVGLDVSQEVTHLCVVDSNGTTVWQGKCRSTPEAIAIAIRKNAPDTSRIGLETGPLSTWHWHTLRAMGLPIICMDARHAQAALSMQVNKTDRNDAFGLAQITRMGWYREVDVKSIESHMVRSMLGTRSRLVRMRIDVTNQIRGILKTFGIVMSGARGLSFERRVEEAARGEGILQESLRVLLSLLRSLGEQLLVLDRSARKFTRVNVACRNLMTIPGVGPLTAAAFVTAVDNPERFNKSNDVGAYFGLTPRRYQSGEVDRNGRISKCGDHLVRAYLFEAATVLLTRVEKWSALKAWGLRIARKGTMKKAKVAVARKLAVIMHRMWITGEEFRWSNAETPAA